MDTEITQLWIAHREFSARQYDPHFAQHGPPPEESGKTSSTYLNRMQRAFELMNIKLHTIISDIDGGKETQVEKPRHH